MTAERGEKLWEPSAEAIERSQMTAYMRWLAAEHGIEASDYEALWEWSVDQLEDDADRPAGSPPDAGTKA